MNFKVEVTSRPASAHIVFSDSVSDGASLHLPPPRRFQTYEMKALAVVTGANTGIGFEIARALSATHRVVIGARDAAKGAAAAAALREEGRDAVFLAPLNVTDPASVRAFASAVATESQPLALLINNAGLAFKGDTFGAPEARATIDTNFYGTLRVTDALLPLLRAHGCGARIVNVCSVAGRLGQVAPQLQARFAARDATPASLGALMEEFVSAVAAGDYAARGWPRSMYGVSKLGEIAYSLCLARALACEGIVVNACCPGYCATAMSSFRGSQTPAQGADTPVWLAMRAGAPEALTGGFFAERGERTW